MWLNLERLQGAPNPIQHRRNFRGAIRFVIGHVGVHFAQQLLAKRIRIVSARVRFVVEKVFLSCII